MTYNKDLPHAEERNLILSSLKDVIKFSGTVEIDNDDENGHFTLTQTYYWDGKTQVRTISGQLLVTDVKVEEQA